MQKAAAFLSTNVKQPDTYDYKKWTWVIKYLHHRVPDLPLTLEANDTHIGKWLAGGLMHQKSHMGSTIMMSKGTVYSTSIKQKINTWSLTKVELVGVTNDVMVMVLLWMQHFLEVQGYIREHIYAISSGSLLFFLLFMSFFSYFPLSYLVNFPFCS